MVDTSGSWACDQLSTILPNEVLPQILGVKPPTIDAGDDCCVQKWGTQNQFTVCLVYAQLLDPSIDALNTIWKQVWALKVPQRIRAFLWLVLKERILTNHDRGSQPGEFDAICNSTMVLLCFSPKWIRANLACNAIVPNLNCSWSMLFATILWQTWKCQNSFTFTDSCHTMKNVLRHSLTCSANFATNQNTTADSTTRQAKQIMWKLVSEPAAINERPVDFTGDSKWNEMDGNAMANFHLALDELTSLSCKIGEQERAELYFKVYRIPAVLQEENRRKNKEDKQVNLQQAEALTTMTTMRGRSTERGQSSSHKNGLKKNLLSYGLLDIMQARLKHGRNHEGVPGALVVLKGEKIAANLYMLKGETLLEAEASVASCSSDSAMLWHQKLGHMSEQGMKVLVEQKLLPSLTNVSLPLCEHYIKNKQHRFKFNTSNSRGKSVLELVHSDVWQAPVTSLGGSKYFVSLLMTTPGDVGCTLLREVRCVSTFKNFKARVELDSGNKIKCFRTDNGGEYTSEEFDDFCRKEGIKRQFTVANTPHGCTLLREVRCVSTFKNFKARVELDSGNKIKCFRTDNGGEYTSEEFDDFCRKEGIKRQFTVANPSTKWSGRADEQNLVRKNKSNVEECRPRKIILGRSSQYRMLFGESSSINCNRAEDTNGDVDWKCKFLGYADGVKGYRLWDPTARKVIISRDVIFVEDKLQRKENDASAEKSETTHIHVEKEVEQGDSSEAEPVHDEQELESSEAPITRQSDRVRRRPNWNSDYVRRLVVKGYAQKEEKLDVKTVFLHGNLEEEIYMLQPEGFEEKEKKNLVYRLNKSLYGLKQAPRCWYKRLIPSLCALDITDLMQTLVLNSRDIAQAVGVVSRYMANPGKEHWNIVKRILRYIKGTSNVALCYGGSNLLINGHVDSDYAEDLDKSKSTTGYVFKVAGGAVSWVSKLQSVMDTSTTEAEYVAATQASKEAIWLKMLLEELGHNQEHMPLLLLFEVSTLLAVSFALVMALGLLGSIELSIQSDSLQVVKLLNDPGAVHHFPWNMVADGMSKLELPSDYMLRLFNSPLVSIKPLVDRDVQGLPYVKLSVAV
ncbi:hypothetical protein F3Y22_tig00110893pilonHSYRG00252 [Hibiscus syriacus]|uniref:Integrase catalytic domain-containing protein n=1 Tax=Hibiscus syriacus TaxID=106335 RepID=A0A6A2ZI81_HIBSY|nr:hypothetical protein F3Y22_tig00110893pilonHSYRG00252 [Hibiscus syriacus]